MNPVERLRDDLAQRFPNLIVAIDEPADVQGSWFLDVRRDGGALALVVEWRPDRGFGVTTPEAGDYGSRPDELYPNPKAAFECVVRLVLSGGRTEPASGLRLAEM